MPTDLDAALSAFRDDDYSVRLVRAVCAVVPFAPEIAHYHSVAEHLTRVDPKAKKPVLDRAVEIARADDAQRALWIADAMDTADSGITMFTGVATAVNLYRSKHGERLDALETDQQQAADAVLKGLALAYFVWKLFPGGPTEKVAAFRALPSGQALAFYYAAIELGLPFADNALTGGGGLLRDLYAKYGPQQVQKFAAVAGDEAAQGAVSVFDQLMGPVDSLVQMTSTHVGPIVEAASSYVPGAMNVGDKAAGMVATAADALHVYRYLGARVVAEACVVRALAEKPSDKPAMATNHPAGDEIKYTTKKPGKDEIVVQQPPARRGWCLIFALMIASSGAGTLAGLGALLYALVTP